MAGGASRTDGVLWGCFLWQRHDSRPPKDAGRGGGSLAAAWMDASVSTVQLWVRRRVLAASCRYIISSVS